MNVENLELPLKLLKCIELILVDCRIKMYFKDKFVLFLCLLFFPILYLSFCIAIILTNSILTKVYSKKVYFEESEQYRQNRILYDATLLVTVKISAFLKQLKSSSIFLYVLVLPIKIIYSTLDSYCKIVKKEFEKLDKPSKEGALFRSILEEELWNSRTKCYKYRI